VEEDFTEGGKGSEGGLCLGGGLVGRHLKIHDPLPSSLPSVRNEEFLQKAAKTAKVEK
jgi:hypothetical protein